MALNLKSKIVLFVAAVGLVLCAILWLRAPGYLESRVLPQLAKSAGIDEFSCDIRKIGLFGADLGMVRLGGPNNPAIIIGSIQMDYSPWGLMHGRIKKIVAAGVSVNCVFDDNGFSLRGLDFKNQPVNKAIETDSTQKDLKLPVDVGLFEVQSASVNCVWQGRQYRLPLEIKVLPHGPDAYKCSIKLHPRGQDFLCDARVDLKNKSIKAFVRALVLELARFADFQKLAPGLSASGQAKIEGHIKFKGQDSFEAKASCVLSQGKIGVGSLVLHSKKESPLKLEINKAGENWIVSAQNISLTQPLALDFPKMNLTITPKDKGLSGTGKFEYAISLNQDILPISGFGKISAAFTENQAGEFLVLMPNINAMAGDIKVMVPELSLTGTRTSGKDPVLNAMLEFSGAEISGSKSQFDVSRLRAKIPFSWPGSGKKGGISADSIKIKDMDLGPVLIDVAQNDLLVEFFLTHENALIPGLSLSINGKCGLDEFGEFVARADFEIPEHQLTDLDFGKFSNSANGVELSGKLKASGFVELDKNDLKTSAEIGLSQGVVKSSDQDIEVSGIEVSLVMPDLSSIKSAPKQVLAFEKARLGDINISNARIEFNVESQNSFFIERSSFDWCNGHVYSPSVRILANVSDYDLLLYCDRLDFANVMKQLGGMDAKGDGSLNGVIPVRIRKGQVSFANGHLYSTPGDTGTIRLKGTQSLLAGIPPDSPQFMQLELARKALEDYNYTWAKLEIDSIDQTLYLKMKLDGKPAGPLPFVYKKEIGGFARVDASSPGSVFQGIGFDLNFQLPFNLMMQYGKNFKDLF